MSEIEAVTVSKEAIEAIAEELFAIFVGHMWANQHEGQKASYRLRAERLLKFTAALPLARPTPSQNDEFSDEFIANDIYEAACLIFKSDLTHWKVHPSSEDGSHMTAGKLAEILRQDRVAVRAEAMLAGAAAEREECAKVANRFVLPAAGSEHELGCNYAATEIEAAIRARK